MRQKNAEVLPILAWHRLKGFLQHLRHIAVAVRILHTANIQLFSFHLK